MSAASVLDAGPVAAWPRLAIAAIAQIFTPRRAPRAAARRSSAPASAPPAGPPPELARRFHDAAMPLLDDAYSFARYLCRDAGAAEDIVHDAYLRGLRGFAGFRGEALRPWLFAIVRNCFLSWAKAAGRPVPDEMGEAEAEPIEAETPETLLIRSSDEEALRALIAALPLPYREVLVLREIEQLSYREIAETIDAPTGTVMSRLARARERLAAAWRAREAGTGAAR